MSEQKYKKGIWLAILTVVIFSGRVVEAEEPCCPPLENKASNKQSAPSADFFKRETLTGSWFGLGRELADKTGIQIDLSLTQVYQINLHGGLSTHRKAGRYTGSYDLELNADLEKLINWKGASIYVGAEGGWSDGLDDSSIGSLFEVNADVVGARSVDIVEYTFEQWFGDRLAIRIGKIDLTGGFEQHGCPVCFDSNTFANDATTQFLNGAFSNNPIIPFPENGLGFSIFANPWNCWYVSAGVADATADARETGFNTAFSSPIDWFVIFETGLTPQLPTNGKKLQGAYRVGFCFDSTPLDRFDGNGTKSDNIGFYLSFDQVVFKENDGQDDSQGLGLFARYGFADGDVNEIKQFWSFGGQYQGLIPGRHDDVIGVGAAQGLLSSKAGFSASNETAIEVYYNAKITPWLSVSPSVQYIINPGGNSNVSDAVVAGLRLQMAF